MNLNRVILSARLCADPQLKYLPSQTSVVELRLACNKRWKTSTGEDKEKAIFVDAKAFGKTADAINEHFQKGKEICVEASLDYDEWEDKTTGSKRSKVTLLIDRFHFVGSKAELPQPGDPWDADKGQPHPRDNSDQHPQPARRPAPSQRPRIADAFVGEVEFRDEDVPFAWEGPSRQPL